MKIKKLKNLDNHGFTHDIVAVLFVMIFAVAGVAYLVASHADSPNASSSSQLVSMPPSLAPTPTGSKAVAHSAGAGTFLTPIYSYSWTGYIVDQSGKDQFSSVNASLKVPSVSCKNPQAQTLFWVGFDGNPTTSNLEQANESVEQDGIGAKCVPGSASGSVAAIEYYAWWETWPYNSIQKMPLTIAKGDNISMNASYANSKFVLTVSDLTQHSTFTKKTTCPASYQCLRTSVEWIFERPSNRVTNKTYPLADWHTAKMYNLGVAINGSNPQPISAFPGVYSPIYMTSNSNVVIATSQNPINVSGDSFTAQWRASQ
jgi:hypothetical protein